MSEKRSGKPNIDIAYEIISGKNAWGNGEHRKLDLRKYGYDYEHIQNIINSIIPIGKKIDTYRITGNTINTNNWVSTTGAEPNSFNHITAREEKTFFEKIKDLFKRDKGTDDVPEDSDDSLITNPPELEDALKTIRLHQNPTGGARIYHGKDASEESVLDAYFRSEERLMKPEMKISKEELYDILREYDEEISTYNQELKNLFDTVDKKGVVPISKVQSVYEGLGEIFIKMSTKTKE